MTPDWSRYAGTALLALTSAFLALDAGMKLAGAEAAIAVTGKLGFSASATRLIGLLLAAITIFYLVPMTRLLGAVLLTGYLGGAVAVQAQHGSPVATHILFGVYIGMMLWASLWLRSPELRQWLPLRRHAGR